MGLSMFQKYFPFALAFIVLPMILHKGTRTLFPRNSTAPFHEWLEKNSFIKIDLPERVQNLMPFTREALLFLIMHDAIEFDQEGHVSAGAYRKVSISRDKEDELTEIFRQAEFFGKWLVDAGDTSSIFIFLGIKP